MQQTHSATTIHFNRTATDLLRHEIHIRNPVGLDVENIRKLLFSMGADPNVSNEDTGETLVQFVASNMRTFSYQTPPLFIGQFLRAGYLICKSPAI